MKNHIHRTESGFSLLEVLIAVVILSFGLLALATLQLSLFKSSAASKAQSVALSLAKGKIETMRSFKTLDDYIALTDSGPANTTAGGTTYAMTTTVDRYVFGVPTTGTSEFKSVGDTTTEAVLEASTDPKYILGRDFKRVQVKVEWDESTGGTTGHRTLTLEDVIDGLDPADSAKVLKNSTNTLPRNVQVIIENPGNEAGVIPIAIGDGTDTAATNPRPVVNQSATETRFDIYTYSALSGNLAAAQSRVETNVIGCTCDTANAPTDTTARGYRPTYWNGTRYVAPTLTTYKPDAGQATVSKKGTAESPYCTICCRDHEDPASLSANQPRFDPWRSTHTHYGLDNNDALVPVGSTQTKYLEACRLIRVDGIYRVAADPRDDYFDLLATKNDGSTTEYAPTATATTNYQDFVLGYLDAKVVNNTTPSTYNNRVASATVATLAGNSADTTSIDYPASITLQRSGDHKYLHSRGLYIDYLEPEALAAIASAKQNCVTNSCSTSEKQAAILSVLPFTSINLTELAGWSPLVDANQYISVSNGGFSTALSSDTPVRGYTVPNLLTSGQLTATATTMMRDSTSGLQVLYDTYIDADERDDTAAHLSDTQAFDIPAGGSGNNNGQFTIAFTGYDFGVFPNFAGTTNTTNCTYAKVGNGNNATYQYTCSASSMPVSSMDLKVSSYNYTAPASTGLSITCTKSDGTTPLPYTTKNNDTALVTCKNYDLTSVVSNAGGVTATSPVATNPGLVGEYSNSTISTVSNGDTLTLNFSGPTTTFAGYTCIYSQTQGGAPKNPIIQSTNASCP